MLPASLITCAGGLGTHGINGRKQGRRCNNSSSSAAQVHLPWATRALTYSPIFSSNSKRLSTISPTASVAVGSNGAPVLQPSEPTHLSRKSFPDGFVFGAATSSYQIEGAWDKGGKGPSVWDHYCHSFPDKIKGKANGDEAVNSYELYEDDVKMLNAMGMKAYRFSISWPRILKTGKLKDGINYEGIYYYNNLINKLKENGIEPYITLFHWETPQALDDAYGSFLNERIVDDFKDYAEVCFKHFGDRVKHWFTFNEPYVFCTNAYGIGKHAPGRCSKDVGCAVPEGDSLVEPYKAGHNLLLAHAETVHLYRTKYKDLQKGKIGIALVSMGYKAYDNTTHVHEQAQNRSIDFNLGWFMEPLSHGHYPFTVKALVKERLPSFTISQQKLIKGSFDMIGLNYYTSRFSRSKELSSFKPSQNSEDACSEALVKGPDEQHIGPNTGASWLYSYPEGLKDLLMIMMKRYGNPEIYITENGVGDIDNGNDDKDKFLNDTTRMQYLKDHLAKLKEAIDAGVNVRGHFTWSLMDNFEWHNGYTQRFGLIYVDRKNGFKREMKKSAEWFAVFNGVAGGGEKIAPYESSASPVSDNGSTGDNNIKTPGSNNGGLPSATDIDDPLLQATSSH